MNKKDIILAGGCFWGTEKYLSVIPGVVETEAGYVNGSTEKPTYEEVCYEGTGHAEAVRVVYDADRISLHRLLQLFFESIDPTVLNRQGPDAGSQYRTGIYFTNESDKEIAIEELNILQTKYEKKIVVEVKKIENYSAAEVYHQKYLEKNPFGYCHINRQTIEKAKDG